MTFFQGFFDTEGFMPHGMCLVWRPSVFWLQIVSDALIALAYYSIPVALVYFVRRRKDMAFPWIFYMFGAFILACGTTHLASIWTMWNPDYGVEALLKAVTAAISITTAVLLWPLMPKALALPSAAQIQETAEELRREIQMRKETEQQLRDSQNKEQEWKTETRFRQVVEAAPSAMVMVGPGGRIEMVNAQASRVFGYDQSELLGQPLEMLVPERFRGQHPGLRDLYSAHAESRPMGAGRDLYALRKDGIEFPVEIGLNPIETEDGQMVLSAIVDISARKRLEDRFRRVVEFAPTAMVMINQNGRIVLVNAQAEKLFAYSRSELLGRPIEMLVPERFRHNHPGLRSTYYATPQSRPMGAGRDLYGLRKDGAEFAVEIGLNPIETDEGTMVLSSVVDISDRKQKEESIQNALREKDLLLGEIHHRVKNNLQVIHSLLNLQANRVDNPVLIEMLRESQNRVKSMALIHQTLYESHDFARIDFGNFLETLAPSLITSYSIDPERVTLSVTAGEVLLPIDAAIPCGLIVNELISNALKHAFPGNLKGAITVTLSSPQKNQAMLTVSDDGIGLPEGLDPRHSGTLGLKLVELLADQLGGMVAIHRAAPTAFTLSFPIEKNIA